MPRKPASGTEEIHACKVFKSTEPSTVGLMPFRPLIKGTQSRGISAMGTYMDCSSSPNRILKFKHKNAVVSTGNWHMSIGN